jgi:hypothetical protein
VPTAGTVLIRASFNPCSALRLGKAVGSIGLIELFNLYFPTKIKKPNRTVIAMEPWMTRGILTSHLTKNKLSVTALKYPTPLNKKQIQTI